MKFTEKQKLFIQAKANGLPSRQAALAAGYSGSGAAANASALWAKPEVRAAVKKMREEMGADAPDEINPGKPTVLKDRYESPLDLFTDLMNNPKAPDGLRIEAAKQAMQYMHAKPNPTGKRQNAKDLANTVANGNVSKFSPGKQPSHLKAA